LKYNPQIIVWPGITFEKSVPNPLYVSPFADFSRQHNVYLVGFVGEMQKMDFGYGVVSPEGSVGADNLGYHVFTIPRDIMARDIKGLFFPEVYSLTTNLGEIGVADCMESGSTLPTLARVRKGMQFLVVPTGSPNTYVFSWVLGTSAIYRAVEHRIFAVEVIGDHDSSMIIDPYGRIVDDMAAEPEMVVGKISFTNERTFYTRYGDIFGCSIVGLALLLVGYNAYLQRKRPLKYCVNDNCRAEVEKDAKTCEKCGKSQKRRPLWQKILWFIVKP